jgi:hypothetical protein
LQPLIRNCEIWIKEFTVHGGVLTHAMLNYQERGC